MCSRIRSISVPLLLIVLSACGGGFTSSGISQTGGSPLNLQSAGATTVGIQGATSSSSDTDGDAVPDSQDNCINVNNPDQRDTNVNGFGNACDADFDNNGVVNINDFNRLKARLNVLPVIDEATDLDGNGVVNINDLNRLKSFLGKPPGPSGIAGDGIYDSSIYDVAAYRWEPTSGVYDTTALP